MTTHHIAYREFAVMDGGVTLSTGEIRYAFTIIPGRPARTWANAADGFHPAEDAAVDVKEVAIRTHHTHPWRICEGACFDAFCSDIPDDWFLAQAMEDAE